MIWIFGDKVTYILRSTNFSPQLHLSQETRKITGALEKKVCGYMCVCAVSKAYLTLCDLMNCSLPGSSAHGISQAKILEWVAIFSSRGSSWPRDQMRISWSPILPGRYFITVSLGNALKHRTLSPSFRYLKFAHFSGITFRCFT